MSSSTLENNEEFHLDNKQSGNNISSDIPSLKNESNLSDLIRPTTMSVTKPMNMNSVSASKNSDEFIGRNYDVTYGNYIGSLSRAGTKNNLLFDGNSSTPRERMEIDVLSEASKNLDQHEVKKLLETFLVTKSSRRQSFEADVIPTTLNQRSPILSEGLSTIIPKQAVSIKIPSVPPSPNIDRILKKNPKSINSSDDDNESEEEEEEEEGSRDGDESEEEDESEDENLPIEDRLEKSKSDIKKTKATIANLVKQITQYKIVIEDEKNMLEEQMRGEKSKTREAEETIKKLEASYAETISSTVTEYETRIKELEEEISYKNKEHIGNLQTLLQEMLLIEQTNEDINKNLEEERAENLKLKENLEDNKKIIEQMNEKIGNLEKENESFHSSSSYGESHKRTDSSLSQNSNTSDDDIRKKYSDLSREFDIERKKLRNINVLINQIKLLSVTESKNEDEERKVILKKLLDEKDSHSKTSNELEEERKKLLSMKEQNEKLQHRLKEILTGQASYLKDLSEDKDTSLQPKEVISMLQYQIRSKDPRSTMTLKDVVTEDSLSRQFSSALAANKTKMPLVMDIFSNEKDLPPPYSNSNNKMKSESSLSNDGKILSPSLSKSRSDHDFFTGKVMNNEDLINKLKLFEGTSLSRNTMRIRQNIMKNIEQAKEEIQKSESRSLTPINEFSNDPRLPNYRHLRAALSSSPGKFGTISGSPPKFMEQLVGGKDLDWIPQIDNEGRVNYLNKVTGEISRVHPSVIAAEEQARRERKERHRKRRRERKEKEKEKEREKEREKEKEKEKEREREKEKEREREQRDYDNPRISRFSIGSGSGGSTISSGSFSPLQSRRNIGSMSPTFSKSLKDINQFAKDDLSPTHSISKVSELPIAGDITFRGSISDYQSRSKSLRMDRNEWEKLNLEISKDDKKKEKKEKKEKKKSGSYFTSSPILLNSSSDNKINDPSPTLRSTKSHGGAILRGLNVPDSQEFRERSESLESHGSTSSDLSPSSSLSPIVLHSKKDGKKKEKIEKDRDKKEKKEQDKKEKENNKDERKKVRGSILYNVFGSKKDVVEKEKIKDKDKEEEKEKEKDSLEDRNEEEKRTFGIDLKYSLYSLTNNSS